MRKAPWNNDVVLPWEKIKEVWDGYWDQEKPLLVEKSPPNLIRADDIVKHFQPVYFIIMVRNPYALCEGLHRRNKWDAVKAAKFSIRCLRKQAENAKNLQNAICIRYEELVEDPKSVSQKIQSFLPQLGDLDYNSEFTSHSVDGYIKREIVNLNKTKIDRLSLGYLMGINKIIKENSDVMEYWGYEYYGLSLSRTVSYLFRKCKLLLSETLFKGKLGGR
jgi:hypothetical protein